jgi:Rad3-related DNA helicase
MTIDEAKNSLQNYANKDWRKYQRECCEFIINSDKKFVIIEAGTGSGKSLTAMSVGMANNSLTYAVHSKVLQQQIVSDFPEAKLLQGRNNYKCLADDTLSCDECRHTKNNPCYHKKSSCLYSVAKRIVLASKLKILNYDYLLSELAYAGQFSGANLYIIDEADNLENSLIQFTTLTFTPFALRRLGLTEPARKTATSKQGISPWLDFGQIAKDRVGRIIASLTNEIESYGSKEGVTDQQISKIKERTRVVRLSERIDIFLDKVDDSWIYEENEGKLTFRPLWVTPDLADDFLWNHGKKWCLMSASFLPIDMQCKVLGIPMDEVDYMQVPSTFDPKRRPIHIRPVANMTAKTAYEETPKLCKEIENVLKEHPESKGIIHTASYKLAKDIMEMVNDKRLIIHNSQDRQMVIDMFKESDKPLVLVSPSLERGISLPDDECEFIICVKALYASLGDKIVSQRVYSSGIGNYWYKSMAAQAIIQASGRGMRHEKDHCDIFLLDVQIKKLIEENPKLFPEYWLDAIVFG